MTGTVSVTSKWAASLLELDARLGQALGPMLGVLEDLVSRLDQAASPLGDPDGYDGITQRGHVARLLADQWLLASEVPDEFLRRAAEHELRYLRPAFRDAASRGAVVAIVDCGLDQLGSTRLVQLAALVVLHRRAKDAGTELRVRFLPGGQEAAGELQAIVQHWLQARSLEPSTEAQLALIEQDLDQADHVWLLTGPELRSKRPAHQRTLSSWPVSWGASGVTHVGIRVGDATTRLEVPEPKAAVAALRGEGLLRRRPDSTIVGVPTTGRGASFGSADARLLWRGVGSNEIYGCFVGGSDSSKVRRYLMQGQVVAASSLGRRIVAVVSDGVAVWVQVIGKKLARVERFHFSVSDLGLDGETLATIAMAPLGPVYLQGGNLLIRIHGTWHCLTQERAFTVPSLAAVGPGTALDAPREVYAHSGKLWSGSARWSVPHLAGVPVLGPADRGLLGWTEDTRRWRITRHADISAEIAVDETDQVLGLAEVSGEPSLIVVSASGRILRQVSANHIKTWTRWAGPAHFCVHPHRPWLARTTSDRITVGDLTSGDVLLDIHVAS